MKLLSAIATLALSGLAVASDEGGGEMERLMAMKEETRAAQRADGVFDNQRSFFSAQATQKCVNGKTQGVPGQIQFGCENVDLHGFISHGDMGSITKEGNDVWGWTSPDGREFGAVGATDGTSFVEVKSDGSLVFLARLPTQTTSAIWRDIKVIDGYAYISSEAPGHGLQVFDLRKLLTIKEPVTLDIKKDLTFWWNKFGSAHNVIANEEEKMIYVCGTSRSSACKGGLYMLDVSNPNAITTPGCASEDGYTHDAQCVTYKGPDTQYLGKQICFAYNEETLTIWDVTNKSAPKIISRTAYVGASYTHQGWLTDMNDMAYLLLDDELDEMDGKGLAKNGRTTTHIFNVTSLAKPFNSGQYQSPVKAIDHNQYVKDGLSYQSNYGSGLRIVDVSSIESDATGKNFKQVGFFDCHPEDDDRGGDVEFFGSWSVYPYFKSGYLLLNSIERGIFSVKYTG
ncbi:MAG: hypothetical protein M1832_001554 [Thelocarpon impressellum]|nr:MAG: hypothetical protein M1832_001554 [Thelocarpon impressellum]